MRVIILSMVLLVVSGCAKETLSVSTSTTLGVDNTIPATKFECGDNTTSETCYILTAKEAFQKRVYLLHGFGNDWTMWSSEPYRSFVYEMLDLGYDIIFITIPYFKNVDQTRSLMANSADFYQMWTSRIARVKSGVENRYGLVSTNIVGGISFGGHHALLAATTHLFDAYFALLPLVDPQSLSELSDIYAPNANVLNYVSSLSDIPGYVSWGTQDSRVDYVKSMELTVSLIGFGASISYKAHLNHGHAGSMELFAGALNFIE